MDTLRDESQSNEPDWVEDPHLLSSLPIKDAHDIQALLRAIRSRPKGPPKVCFATLLIVVKALPPLGTALTFTGNGRWLGR
jgi:hypothetical protein